MAPLVPDLRQLELALAALPDMPGGWGSLDVDYEPPRVERAWRDLDNGLRLYLHRIHPCERALYHPHPWPSSVKILSGSYEMGIGYGHGVDPPPRAATVILGAGASYEMLDPDGWHYVRPIGGPSLSVMITGAPWSRRHPGEKKPKKGLRPLETEALRQLVRDVNDSLRACPGRSP